VGEGEEGGEGRERKENPYGDTKYKMIYQK
jgi:hypothetical protein